MLVGGLAGMGQWWSEVVAGVEQGLNAACVAVFDPNTNSALFQQPESAQKNYMGLYGPLRLM